MLQGVYAFIGLIFLAGIALISSIDNTKESIKTK